MLGEGAGGNGEGVPPSARGSGKNLLATLAVTDAGRLAVLPTLRSKLTYANVMATIAVFVALGGGAYAAIKLPANSVGSKQIKKKAVTPAKVAPATVRLFKKGNQGAQGGQGPRGDAGASGTPGTPGSDMPGVMLTGGSIGGTANGPPTTRLSGTSPTRVNLLRTTLSS